MFMDYVMIRADTARRVPTSGNNRGIYTKKIKLSKEKKLWQI